MGGEREGKDGGMEGGEIKKRFGGNEVEMGMGMEFGIEGDYW